jgi:hypothetical protein
VLFVGESTLPARHELDGIDAARDDVFGLIDFPPSARADAGENPILAEFETSFEAHGIQ